MAAQRRLLLAVGREEGEVGLDGLDALVVVVHLEVADPRLAAVDLGAAEVLHRDVLAGHGLGQVRARERHRALADHHRHEVREPRDVGGPGRAGAEHRGHQRHDARHRHLLAEQVPGAGEQAARGLLDSRPGRVEQPDQRHPLLQRQLAQAAHLQLPGHPHRAGHHREVVGGDRARPAVDVAPAGDHAVGRRLAALHRALGEVRTGVDAHLDERARVDQQVDPLAGRELAALVLEGDLLLAAAELRLSRRSWRSSTSGRIPVSSPVLRSRPGPPGPQLPCRLGHLACLVGGLRVLGHRIVPSRSARAFRRTRSRPRSRPRWRARS